MKANTTKRIIKAWEHGIEPYNLPAKPDIIRMLRTDMKPSNYHPVEATADFRERIAILMRARETGKRYSVIGGPRADDCVVRKPFPSILQSEEDKRYGRTR